MPSRLVLADTGTDCRVRTCRHKSKLGDCLLPAASDLECSRKWDKPTGAWAGSLPPGAGYGCCFVAGWPWKQPPQCVGLGCSPGAAAWGASLGVETSWDTCMRGQGVIWWEGRRQGSSVPAQGINGISKDYSLGQCSTKLCLLGLKPFFSNKSPGYHESTWQAAEPKQAAVPGCLALWLGEEGERASGAVPSSGNKVRLCLLLKCRGEISASWLSLSQYKWRLEMETDLCWWLWQQHRNLALVLLWSYFMQRNKHVW